jgi:hypothetical protein
MIIATEKATNPAAPRNSSESQQVMTIAAAP